MRSFFSQKKPEKDIVCNAAGGQENLFVAMCTNKLNCVEENINQR
jgi:hypothetical protein